MKAELDKRGLRKSGNKSTLFERLRAAIIREGISHSIDNDRLIPETERPSKDQSPMRRGLADNDLHLFIEAKVKEVCRCEIENLKVEASSSYVNETIKTLQKDSLRSSRFLSFSRRRSKKPAINRASAWGEQKIREKWGRGEREGGGGGEERNRLHFTELRSPTNGEQ